MVHWGRFVSQGAETRDLPQSDARDSRHPHSPKHIGWQDEPLWQLRNVDDATEEALEQLRITELWSHPPTPKHPPGFYLMPEPWGDWNKGIEELPGFVSDLLAGPRMERLRRQLVARF